MLDIIGSYWIDITAPGSLFSLEYTTDPFPSGTNIYANISLSAFNTGFPNTSPDPNQKSAAIAQILSYNVHLFGQEVGPISPADRQANALFVNNCAKMTFRLSGQYISAKALINIFRF
jgi:hypothetical protein